MRCCEVLPTNGSQTVNYFLPTISDYSKLLENKNNSFMNKQCVLGNQVSIKEFND